MTTQSQSGTLLPATNPETIIRTANTARQKAKIESHLHPEPAEPSTQETLLTMSSLQPLHPAAPTDHNRQPLSTMTTPDTLGLHEYLKGFIQLQHQSIDQANADRLEAREACKADAIRIARLEESIRSLSIQPETKGPSLEPRYSDRVDLQRFRSSDGPIYSGPFQAVEPFISWIRGVQIFFATKAVSHDNDKIRIVGGLIRETNTLAFYASSVENYVGQP